MLSKTAVLRYYLLLCAGLLLDAAFTASDGEGFILTDDDGSLHIRSGPGANVFVNDISLTSCCANTVGTRERWHNIASGRNPVRVVSLHDNNEIFVDGKSTGQVLAQGQQFTFESTIFDGLITDESVLQGSTGNIIVHGTTAFPSTVREWVPERLAGRTFGTFHTHRDNFDNFSCVVIVKAVEDCDRVIFKSERTPIFDGPLTSGQRARLLVMANTTSTVESSAKVLVTSYCGEGVESENTLGFTDYRGWEPATNQLVGWGSRPVALVSSSEVAEFSVQCTAGASTLNSSQGFAKRLDGVFETQLDYGGPACLISAMPGVLLSAVTWGDGAGGSATAFQSQTNFKTHFVIPEASQRLSVAMVGTGSFFITTPEGSFIRTDMPAPSSSGVSSITLKQDLPVGTHIYCTRPSFVIADTQLDSREFTVYGFDSFS